jgi:hypothetical protein
LVSRWYRKPPKPLAEHRGLVAASPRKHLKSAALGAIALQRSTLGRYARIERPSKQINRHRYLSPVPIVRMVSEAHTAIANRMYEVILGAITPHLAWGFYLHNPEFAGEEELKNKLFVIWACSVTDTVEAGPNFLPRAIADAEEKGFSDLAHNGRQILSFVRLASDFMSQFTRRSQIVLLDMRNQWVHGYFNSRHRLDIPVKFVVRGTLVSERLSPSEYALLLEEHHLLPGTFDDKLSCLRKAAFERPHPYWTAIETFRESHKQFYDMLRADVRFDISIPEQFAYS